MTESERAEDAEAEWRRQVADTLKTIVRKLDAQSSAMRGLAEAQQRLEEESLAAIDIRLGGLGKDVADVRARFVAIGHRFEEVERRLDTLGQDVQEVRGEVVSRSTQNLNALHAVLGFRAKLEAISARLDALEARLARTVRAG